MSLPESSLNPPNFLQQNLQKKIETPANRLKDKFDREIHYLRISLTDACNLRCVYCMPEDMKFRPRNELLSTAELQRLLPIFSRLGFDKFRFTGGEPTLHPDLLQIIESAASLPSSPFVAMTTNGIKLAKLSKSLKAAGLQRVNISLDTLNEERFKQITRRGGLQNVLKGLHAAYEAGLEVKINTVMVQNFNETDMIPLARLSIEYPWQIRFLEMMPFGNNQSFQTKNYMTESHIFKRIEESLGELHPVGEGLDGEAKVYRLPDAKGTIGFISPVSAPFCASCNRTRLTADGKLRLCLLKDDEVDLMAPLRSDGNDADLEELIRAGIYKKPWGHDLAHHKFSRLRGMSEIGG